MTVRRVRRPVRIERPGLHVVADIEAVIATGDGDAHTSVASSTQKVQITQRRSATARSGDDVDDNTTGGTHA